MIKKILLYYSYGGRLFQRGEDRSQGDIEHSSATSIRAANDLGYMAAILRRIGIDVKVQDYMTSKMTKDDYLKDLREFKPDMVVCSITVATLLDDLQTFAAAKQEDKNIITVAKGAYFFHANFSKDNYQMFGPMDYALCGECEAVIDKLVITINQRKNFSELKGVIWKKNETIISNGPADFIDDLDNLPFPARDLLNNKLYIRPDTNEPMATIQVDRGCAFNCSYCLTPEISGNNIRYRSIDNIIEEIKECLFKYDIKNFFFRSDTFTVNRERVIQLCNRIIEQKLQISWAANSRVRPVDYEELSSMRKAGCWLVAFGIESGSEETLRRIKKGATVDDAVNAIRLAKKAKLTTYGFFIIGFPWETKQHINETFKLAKRLKLDYCEVHICVIYPGTPLYKQTMGEDAITDPLDTIGKNYFTNPSGTNNLTVVELMKFRKKMLRSIYFSPLFILKRLSKIRSLAELKNAVRYGVRLALNLLS